MAKSRFVRGHIRELAISVFVGLALVGCGTQTGAGSRTAGQAIQAAPFYAAPVEGSPEEAALALGRRSSYAAPIEGSPEQTAADLGR
jgi:outer membrane PBP1 activator LpoA protein